MTTELLKIYFTYDPETGLFCRKADGKIYNKTNNKGYISIKFDGKEYSAHRLAWLYMTGENPDCFIDHINRNPADNRFSNLRKASYTENNRNRSMARNNTSGYKGVNWHKHRNKWRAEIKVNNKAITLGYFENAIDAHYAYIQASEKYHKQFGCI